MSTAETIRKAKKKAQKTTGVEKIVDAQVTVSTDNWFSIINTALNNNFDAAKADFEKFDTLSEFAASFATTDADREKIAVWESQINNAVKYVPHIVKCLSIFGITPDIIASEIKNIVFKVKSVDEVINELKSFPDVSGLITNVINPLLSDNAQSTVSTIITIDDFKAAVAENERLIDENRRLTDENSRLNKDLIDAITNRAATESSLATAGKTVLELEKRVESLTNTVFDNNSELTSLKRENANLQTAVDNAKAKQTAAEASLETAKQEIESLKKNASNGNTANDQLLDSIKQENANLKAAANDAKAKQTAAEASLETAKQEIESLKKNTSNGNTVGAQLDKLRQENTSLQMAVDDAKLKYAAAKASSDKAEKEIRSLKDDLAKTKEALSDRNNAITDLNNQIAKLTNPQQPQSTPQPNTQLSDAEWWARRAKMLRERNKH